MSSISPLVESTLITTLRVSNGLPFSSSKRTKAASSALEVADNIVFSAGQRTLRCLAGHGYVDLARNTIVVTQRHQTSLGRPHTALVRHSIEFAEIPVSCSSIASFSPREDISSVLKPETRRAYKEIAAAIVDGYR